MNIDFESKPEQSCPESCVSVYGNDVNNKVSVWIHKKRHDFDSSDLLNEKMIMLLNSYLYEFVEHLKRKKFNIENFKLSSPWQ